MKKMMMLVGLTGAMAVAGAMPAQAINKEWSAALGFLGGVLVSDCAHGGWGGPRERYGPPPCERPVYYAPAPVYVQQAPIIVQQPSGHYEYREEQQWVPGFWQYQQIDMNTYRKIWVAGHYQPVQVKVWVQDMP